VAGKTEKKLKTQKKKTAQSFSRGAKKYRPCWRGNIHGKRKKLDAIGKRPEDLGKELDYLKKKRKANQGSRNKQVLAGRKTGRWERKSPGQDTNVYIPGEETDCVTRDKGRKKKGKVKVGTLFVGKTTTTKLYKKKAPELAADPRKKIKRSKNS